jgi:hypothetical protein
MINVVLNLLVALLSLREYEAGTLLKMDVILGLALELYQIGARYRLHIYSLRNYSA